MPNRCGGHGGGNERLVCQQTTKRQASEQLRRGRRAD